MRLWTQQQTGYNDATWHAPTGEIRLSNSARDSAMTLTLIEAIAQHAALGRVIDEATKEIAREAA